jgi:hypothetical protein
MTAGQIVLIIVKTILGTIPFLVTLFLFMYFERPTYPGRSGASAYLLKYMGFFFLCFAISAVNAMALAGIFNLRILLLLIPAAVYALLLALALKIGSTVRAPRPEYDQYRREESHATSGFIYSLVAARKEFSDYYVAGYYRYKKEHPKAKYSLKIAAQGAVKKDKRNPEAQYVLAEYYIDSDEILKAQKHASIALELDPSNEKYKDLVLKLSTAD